MTKINSKIAGLILLGVFAAALNVAAGEPLKEQRALSAAEAWLALIDEGDYERSWNKAAEYFKNGVKPEQWVQTIRSARKPLGKLLSRTVNSATYMTSLPGAPDGEYVVIQFAASFEHKQAAIETVTPMMDRDGNWRVSGYYIK